MRKTLSSSDMAAGRGSRRVPAAGLEGGWAPSLATRVMCSYICSTRQLRALLHSFGHVLGARVCVVQWLGCVLVQTGTAIFR